MTEKWKIRELGTICDILDKYRIPITKRDRKPGEFPYYGASGVLDFVEDYIFDEKLVLIGEDGAKWGPGEKTAFTVEGKCWVNNHAHVIRPDRSIVLDEWIVFFINFTDISKYTTGLTVPKLNQTKLRQIKIPIPPLPEQRRIVAVLDKAFAAIDKATENTQRNLENIRELFQSSLNDVFIHAESSWEIKQIVEVCKVIAGQSPKGKFYNNSGQGLPFYQGKKEFTDKYIGKPTTWTTSVTKEAEKGDILMSVRAPVGPVNFSTERICIGRGLAAIKTLSSLDKEYLFYFFLKNRNEITGNAGAVFNSISKTQIEKIFIPLPPLSLQGQIVTKLDALCVETNKLEDDYRQKLTDLEELRQSLLHKAFAGELVPRENVDILV